MRIDLKKTTFEIGVHVFLKRHEKTAVESVPTCCMTDGNMPHWNVFVCKLVQQNMVCR